MAYLKFKDNVRVPKSLIIAAAAINAAHRLQFDVDVVVTSGNDSQHMTGSKHYTDDALDFRTKTIVRPLLKQAWIHAVGARLGPDYDVILEDEHGPNEHLHVEWNK